jgi:hypothetical protein
MNEEEMKEKIKNFVDDPGVGIEKGVKKGWESVKDFGKNKKIKEVIDDPRVAIEKGVKKGWESVKCIGKEVKSTVKKKSKRKGKKISMNPWT